jgi:hypothetical protein
MGELWREYPPQLPSEEITLAQVDLEDILAVQALAMGSIRMRARTRKTDALNKRYGFAMYEPGSNGDAEEIYDGSTDRYMSCSVRKVAPDQWHMAVSFLSMVNVEELARCNARELYQFDWLRDGRRMAWASTTIRYRNDETAFDLVTDAHPVTQAECTELQFRMRDMCDRVNPLQPGSIYAPAGHAFETPQE